MASQGFSIGDVAGRSGFSRSALRYHESIGLLEPPERVSGRRRYDARALDRLLLIETAQAAGFTLEEIGVLLEGFPARTPISARWKALAATKRAELELQAKRIQAMQDLLGHIENCDCGTRLPAQPRSGSSTQQTGRWTRDRAEGVSGVVTTHLATRPSRLKASSRQ